MENGKNIKPKLLELESLRSSLIEKTLDTTSNNLRLSLYQNYFEKVLPLDNPNIEEAFLKEFLDDYILCIRKYEVWGIEPYITKKLLEQIKKISALKISSENLRSLNFEIDKIEKQFEKLNLILDGKDFENDETNKALFPLIDKDESDGFYGIIESVTVSINKASENDKFIIVPSETEIEKKIFEQCKKSWLLAIDLSKKFVKKPFKYHEVIISFDKKEGFYEGNSLGTALTLSFLELMLKFYNTAYIINIREHSAFTGGITETGEVLCTSEDIIKRKVAAVFFSAIDTFVFPKCEETYAYFALTQLKKTYPGRKLKLIPVEDINDVLNRRDIVDIKKQKFVVRTGKFVKQNWISAVATVLLAVLFSYLYVMDWDDNPSSLYSDGKILFIKNKNGKLLWTKLVTVSNGELLSSSYCFKEAKIVDINNDGRNELIICSERNPITNSFMNSARVVCYSSEGKAIWQYIFKDEVNAHREKLDTEYSIKILDTLTYQNQKSILLFANNNSSFSSALFRLDLKTGERVPGTFWASGHIMGGIIKDIDNDGRPDFVGVGYDNGYEDLVFFINEIDTLNKVRPTTENYLIRNYPVSQMKSYIRFPKTDFDNYYAIRTPGYLQNSFNLDDNSSIYSFSTFLPYKTDESEIGYVINSNFKDIKVVVDSDFRVQRDTLVAHGKLKLPYTDTEEYKNIIKSNILYLKDGKWVRREELE